MPTARAQGRVAGAGFRRRTRRTALFAPWLAIAATFCAIEARAAADCTVSTIPVAFGTYDPLATAPRDSTGRVTVVCTYTFGGSSQVSFSAALSTGGSGTYAQRRLRAGTPFLAYNLYSDTSRTRIWGNGSSGTSVASSSFTVGPGVGNSRREASFIVYGRIPALQDVVPGSYTDSILVTLTF